jgi:hypothetical protein
MLVLFVRAAFALVTGRISEVQRLLGSRTALQELQEAIEEHERYKGA